jgi:hypothetical protein
VFSTLSGVATGLRWFGMTMNENSNPTSANLGVFVVLAVLPIAAYVIAVLVLPLILRGFH